MGAPVVVLLLILLDMKTYARSCIRQDERARMCVVLEQLNAAAHPSSNVTDVGSQDLVAKNGPETRLTLNETYCVRGHFA